MYLEFIEENEINLSDWDKASLIYNHAMASFAEKVDALKELSEKISDEELKKQIQESIKGR